MTLLAMLMITPSHAGPVDDCYAAAQSANPGLSVSGWINGVVDQTSVTIEPFMQWVAKHQANTTQNVTGNSAGIAALNDAMTCMWAAGETTLSAVVLNRKVAVLQIHGVDARKKHPGGSTLASYRYSGLLTLCGTGARAMQFTTTSGGADHIAVPATIRGAYDFTYAFGTANDLIHGNCALTPTSACSVECYGECSSDGSKGECFCDGTGSCQDVYYPDEIIGSSNAIFQWI